METINLYKKKRATVWFMFFLGLAALFFGGYGLILAIQSGFDTRFLGGSWIYVVHVFQGVVFINMGYSIYEKGKYFVAVSDSEISYMLPGFKSVETIKTADIRKIDIKLNIVKIQLGDTLKVLDIKDIEYKPLRQIKSCFEDLQSSLPVDDSLKVK